MGAISVYFFAAATVFLSRASASALQESADASIVGDIHRSGTRGLQDFTEESDCTAPSTVSSLQAVIAASKLNAPSAGDQVDDLEGYCSQYFFLNGGYMRFLTDGERSEMRTPSNVGTTEGFRADSVTARYSGTVRLPSRDIGDGDNYTWMQLHGEGTSWIRLAHYGRKNLPDNDADAIDELWMFIKDGDSDDYELTSLPMGAVPTGDFDASIDLHGDGTVTISAAGFTQNFNIVWGDDINYFKAGVYVQDGNPSNFPVDYKSLTYSLGSIWLWCTHD